GVGFLVGMSEPDRVVDLVRVEAILDEFHLAVFERLPSYALPLFIRVQQEAETTGTFKYRKVELVEDGFDPDKVDDPIWFAHPDKKAYAPLSRDEYETVVSGGYKF
ncbi:MAG: hypothetical protein AAFW65_07250, partial [Pseudomonadota bacterium]